MKKLISILMFSMLILNCNNSEELSKSNQKIITIGGCVTETVFKLDQGQNVIAVDLSSTIPSTVKDLPQVGYIRAISSEGILSLMPDKIITTSDIGPPQVIEQLKNSGVELYILDSPKSSEDIINLIKNIADILKVENKGIEVVNEVGLLNKKITALNSSFKSSPNIVFFMNPSKNSYTAAGKNTRADYLINYLGGNNIFKNDFVKYNKVTVENIIKENPDIILCASLQNKKASELFNNNNNFSSVNAVKNKLVFDIDMGELLSFGPSFYSNVLELIKQINYNGK